MCKNKYFFCYVCKSYEQSSAIKNLKFTAQQSKLMCKYAWNDNFFSNEIFA